MNETKKNPMKIILPVVAAVVTIAAIAMAVLFILPAFQDAEYGIYIREGAVYYTGLKEEEKPLKLSSNPVKEVESEEDDTTILLSLEEAAVLIQENTTYCPSSHNLFYPEKINSETLSYTLNYVNPKGRDSETIKVDTDVYSYKTNKSGSSVAYLKGDKKNLQLYQTKAEESTKVDNQVADFYLTSNGKQLIYRNEDGDLYRYDGKESTRIARDVSSIEYVSEKGDKVYYIRKNDLYLHSTKADEDLKIGKDVSKLIKVYDSGCLFYLSFNEVTYRFADFVSDILAETDALLTEEPVEPIRSDYSNIIAYEEAYSDYEDLLDLYNSKAARNSIRELVEASTTTRTEYGLHYYNKEESITISDSVAAEDAEAFCFAEEVPMLLFKQYIPDYITLDILDLMAGADVETYIDLSLYTTCGNYLFCNGSIDILPHPFAQNLTFTADGTSLYFVDNVLEDTGCGTLYEASFTETGIDRIRKREEDVHYQFCYDTKTDSVAYLTEVAEGYGKLFFNDEKIDKDVLISGFSVIPDSGQLVYYKGMDEETGFASLVLYDGKETTKLSKNAYDYRITPKNHVLYLDSYDEESGSGKLSIYNGTDSWTIANKVSILLP